MALSATKLQPTVAEQSKTRVQAKPAAVVQTDVSNNPIAKTVLDPNTKDDEKVRTLARMITAETLKDVQSFSTYIAQRRTLAQRRLLELTATTAFPRLQSVIGSLQNGVIDFENMMQPMTDDLQAAFDLRTNDQMGNAIKQIAEDKAKEAEWANRRDKISKEQTRITTTKARLQADIVELQADTNWLGNIRGSSARSIEEKTQAIAQLESYDTLALRVEQTALDNEQADYAARTDQYKVQKERLRKMLDLGAPGYVKRVEDIVTKAISFIDNSTSEVGAIRDEFDDLEAQSINILKANGQMVRVTAILDKGIDGANAAHKQQVKDLDAVVANEDELAKVIRVQAKNDIERFVSALSETSISTKKNVTALQEDAVGANNFNSVVMRQQTNLRELHGEGIASVTTNLNMAMQAFNTAALTEAGNNAWQAIGDMNKVTNKIRDNQVVASAMSLDDTNQRIIEKFESLSGVSDALKEANKLRADGITNIASSLKELAEKTAEVQKNLQVNIGLDASADPGSAIADGSPKDSARTKNADLMLQI